MKAKITAPLLLLLSAAIAIFFSLRGVGIGRSRASTPLSAPAKGLLVALNESYPEPPAGQNAATDFAKGFEALQLSKPGDIKLPPIGVPTPLPLKLTYTSIVRSNRESLRYFAEGARHEQSRYPIDLSAGVDMLLPHLPKLKNAGLLLQITAIVHADARQAKEAANDILTALALARSLQNEPPLLSQLTHDGSIALAVSTLEHVFNRTALPGESLSELDKQLSKMQAHQARGNGVDRAMLAEHACSLALFSAPSRLLEILTGSGVQISEDERAGYAARVRDPANLKQDRVHYEETLEQLAVMREQPFPARLRADAFLDQRANEAANQKLLVAGLLLQGLKNRASHEAQCVASLRLAKTAVALERFRAAHTNRYPSQLAELDLGEIASDPFNDHPLRYVPRTQGYLLYSIGSDLEDNSGQRLTHGKGDLAFSVTRRP